MSLYYYNIAMGSMSSLGEMLDNADNDTFNATCSYIAELFLTSVLLVVHSACTPIIETHNVITIYDEITKLVDLGFSRDKAKLLELGGPASNSEMFDALQELAAAVTSFRKKNRLRKKALL